MAIILGNSFIDNLHKQLVSTSPTAPAEQLLDILHASYIVALGEDDTRGTTTGLGNLRCGSTITAVMLQRATMHMVCATLQLGDCTAGACNGRTGAILEGKQLCSSEQHPELSNQCVTREHSFRDTHEQKRIAEAVHEQGWLLAATQRTDVKDGEDRCLSKITKSSSGTTFIFNEPSPGVENPQVIVPSGSGRGANHCAKSSGAGCMAVAYKQCGPQSPVLCVRWLLLTQRLWEY